MGRFHEFLTAKLASFASRREFVREADPTANENAEQAYLAQILKKKRPAPLDRLAGWADALGLDEAERDEFIKMALETHGDSRAVCDLIARLERKLAKRQQEANALRQRVAALEAELTRLGHGLPDTHASG